MDIQDLTASLSVLHHNGVAFSIEERFQLEIALQQLLNEATETDFDELLFWGRVSGVKADYYVAMGVCYNDRFEFPEKKFYWCSPSNDMTFEAFPSLNDQHKDRYDAFAGQLFQGEPKKILVQVEPEAGTKVEEVQKKVQGDLSSTEQEDPESLIVRVNMKEIDRLHYHVKAIENDCHIIPQGSVKLTPKHEVQRNEAFRGLTSQECFQLNNYSHFRNVQDPVKKENLEADDAIFQRDFLDEVVDDKPSGCWSLQKDASGSSAVIRNNVWKGYTAYHKHSSQDHGSIYVGDGLKNENFCFML